MVCCAGEMIFFNINIYYTMKEQSDDEEMKIEEIQKKIKENIFEVF